MTDRRENRGRDGLDGIEAGLTGLLGALGETFAEITRRIESGETEGFDRNQSFEVKRGPVRAQAGIRLRMGGMTAEGSASQPRPRPPAPDQTAGPTKPPHEEIDYEILDTKEQWRLTADLPGVRRSEIALSRSGEQLLIETTGRRRYRTFVPFPPAADPAEIRLVLRNGILDLRLDTAQGGDS